MYSLDTIGALMKYTFFCLLRLLFIFISHPDAIGALLISSLLKLLISFIVQPLSLILGECFLRDLALVLPRAFLLGGGLMDGDLPEDNSSSVGVSPSLEIMSSFPLLRAIGCSTQSPSRTSFPRFQLSATWAQN